MVLFYFPYFAALLTILMCLDLVKLLDFVASNFKKSENKRGKKVCQARAVHYVINTFACIYCYFFRAELNGYHQKRRSATTLVSC